MHNQTGNVWFHLYYYNFLLLLCFLNWSSVAVQLTTIQFDFAFLVGTFRQRDEGYIVFALKRKMNTFILLGGNTNSRTDKNVKHSRKA